MSGYSYVLYAHPVAQPSRAIIWLLALLQFEHQLKVITPGIDTSAPEFLDEVSPLGTIPALLIKDKETGKKVDAITDYLAIADYVCALSGERGTAFLPKDPLVRAKVLQMTVYGQIANRTVTMEIFRPLIIAMRTQQPPQLTKAQIDKFLHPDFEGRVVDMSRAAGWTVAKHDGSPDVDVENPASVFLVPEAGNKPTIADFVNFAETYQLDALGLLGEIYKRRPAFKRWHDAMMAIPGFDKVHEAVKGLCEAQLKTLLPKH